MLGVDVSGEVVEVAEQARRFSVGERVGTGGGYGELTAVAQENLARAREALPPRAL